MIVMAVLAFAPLLVAGVGDDDVEAAVVPRERIDRARDRFRIGDVGDKRQRVASRPPYFFGGLADFVRRAAQHADDAGALTSESNRRSFANPRSGASDQRDLFPQAQPLPCTSL
jgi:hypothetical protein